jgi:hypothetical protein
MSENSPDWVGDGIRQFLAEARAFLRTAVAFTRHPYDFGRGWLAGGAAHALNPLGFLATALAVVGASEVVLAAALHEDDAGATSLGAQLVAALGPFGYYLVWGAGAHVVLRLFPRRGRARRRLRDSCAMTLYAGGGPATAAHLLTLLGVFVALRFGGTPGQQLDFHNAANWWIVAGASVGFTLSCGSLAAGLAGLHQARGYEVALAMLTVLVLTAAGFGMLRPPGHYGLHPTLAWERQGGKRHFAVGLAD